MDRGIATKKHPTSFKISIENYRTVEKLKNTDFSTIYLISDINSKKYFVAKVLKSEKKGQRNTINQEIGIMKIFQHPTIIKFYGYSTIDFDKKHQATLIMDYAQKGSLYDILNKVRGSSSDPNFTNTVRQIILAGVARGMMFLHQHHVIHRDLKPSNILLDEQLHPHISDFGLSKTIDTGEELFHSSPQADIYYAAPELLKKQRYNGKIDVYSFGIIMYEVLTGSFPYPQYKNAKDHYDLRDKIVNENYRPQFTGHIKKSFRHLIERCWSQNPNERPTFEEIFSKLAFNIDNSIYDIYYDNTEEEENQIREDEDDENKYYLENIDVDEFLYYIDGITEGDNTQEKDPLLDSINDLKKENEELRKQIKGFSDQITELNKLASTMQQKFNDEIDKQYQINEINIEKIKNFKKEIKSLKKRLQLKENNTSDLLVDITKYKKGKTIGHHIQGRAVVYRASPINSDNDKNDKVAIKVYREDEHIKIQKDLFINDIEMRASLNHVAILPIIGYSLPKKDDENYSIISPYMVNSDLHQLIQKVSKKKAPANWTTIRAINIFGIAAGMAYLHDKNIICKDLNTSAILLNENYNPKIDKIDLPSLPKKPSSEFKKPIYIAPELYTKSDCSKEVDVYSYAFILYELFTLKIPTTDEFPVVCGSRPSVSIDEIPPQYAELIEGCWNQDAKARPTFKQILQVFVKNIDKYFNKIDGEIISKYIQEASEGIEIPE